MIRYHVKMRDVWKFVIQKQNPFEIITYRKGIKSSCLIGEGSICKREINRKGRYMGEGGKVRER